MIGFLKRWFQSGETDVFVTLIQVVNEDPVMKQTLISILTLAPAQRIAAIDHLTRTMVANHAPADFIDAVSGLKNEDLAQTTLKVIQARS